MMQRRSTVRLKGWQALVALAAGTAFAGMPTPAVPLSTQDVGAPARVDRADGGAADRLAVEAILRVSGEGRRETTATAF